PRNVDHRCPWRRRRRAVGGTGNARRTGLNDTNGVTASLTGIVPSRSGPAMSPERSDRGTPMTRHLTEAQVEHFKQLGYVFPFRAMSPDEAADYRRVIEEYEAASGDDVNKTLKIKGHLALPAIVGLACNPKILDAVEDLIGPNIMLFGASIFAKNGHDPR